MPDSGAGQGTPVGGGSPVSIHAQPLPVTWLSLHRYAKIVDINPVHFWGAVGQDVWPLVGNACSDIWPGYSWQYGSQISRAELAYAIKDAETAIADFVGYPLAPTFVSNEPHEYSGYYNVSKYRSVIAREKKVIAPGRRATTLIEAGTTVVYSDEDGDGFAETAIITVTTDVAPCEVKVYQVDTLADPAWEIRDANSKVTSGATVVLRFDSWLFIDPNLQAAMPTDDGFTAIDITTTANYVATVDVYREYVDTTSVSAEFSWPCVAHCTTNCAVCGTTTQNGCLTVRNSEAGAVVPSPATYDEGWNTATWTVGHVPEYVKIWYQAGDRSEDFLTGRTCDPLSEFWARQIVYLATARLYKPFCQCGNVTAFAKDLQVELTRTGSEGGHAFDWTAIQNPFGTRKGEFMVYRTLAVGGGKHRKISAGAVR